MSRHFAPRALAACVLAVSFGSLLAEDHAGPHWSYTGATGPTHWAGMEPDFGACGIGHAQSPIDIQSAKAQKAALPAIKFDYKTVPLQIIDNGHTVQVNYPPGSSIDVGGHRYELVQFHFHKPSEEAIDGKHQAMVAHLVHKDSDGRLAVVAVLLAPGAANALIATLWSNLPATKGEEAKPAGVQVDVSGLLPADHGYYTFAGSLTTPPCSEGVTWFVLKSPSTVSQAQVGRFGELYANNARPLQALQGRTVQKSE
jgi:carbonic anhydrase